MNTRHTASPSAWEKHNSGPALILSSTKDCYLLIDTNLKIQYFNATALEQVEDKLGFTMSVGMCILDLVPEERKVSLTALYFHVLAGNVQTTESVFSPPHQPVVYFENLFTPAYNTDGTIAGVVVRTTDISEKKRTELLIKDSDERWRFALEAANQGAWDWNMKTDEVVYSTSYKKMYGFEGDELKNTIAEWESRVHPEDEMRMKMSINEHIESNSSYYESIYRLQTKGGAYIWIMARGKIIKDEDGIAIRMIGTHTDLTESIETQNKLNTIAERFTYAAKATGQALWEWDAVTGEVYMSPIFKELFGWEADKNNRFEQWHYYIHPEDQKKTIDSYYKTIEEPNAKTWEAEYRFLKADGSYAIVIDKAYIIRDEDGKTIKVIGATEDISKQKKTEEELYKSNERYDIMLMATHELLWEWNVKDNYIFRAEEGLKKVYGVYDNNSISTKELWMARLHPEDRGKLDTVLSNLLEGVHHQTFEIEYRFRRDNGSYAYIYDRGILLKDDEDKPVRMIGSAQDMSERKRLENEILRNELEYKKLINQATVDSQEQERGEIGKELHDNVNQVLTTTKLYLELALNNEDLVKELIKKSSKNITSVINEIRQLSRSLMDPSLGDLGIIDSINDLIENINLARKIKIGLEIEPEIENCLDKNQKLTVFRIIQESLNNVIKHAKAKFVSIAITCTAGITEVIITDDGVGFHPESTKKGAGLKNITNRVYLINGNFMIDSEPGEGCQIKISFPVR